MGALRCLTRTRMPEHTPPHMPEGKPVRNGGEGDATWEDYADKTRIQTNSKDGSTIYIYQGTSSQHGIQQFSVMKDGTEVTYFVDGRRKQKFPNGAILEVGKDKSRIQTNPDGTRIETDSSGKTFQSNPNGTSLEIFPDNDLYVVEFPLKKSPSDEDCDWPEVKRIQKGENTTHYIASDGTDIQLDKRGMIIVRWAKGYYPLAEKHYSETSQEWCMQVNADGHCDFLIKNGASWSLDRWWDEEKERKLQEDLDRVAAEQAAAAEKERKRQEEIARKKAEEEAAEAERLRLLEEARLRAEAESQAERDRINAEEAARRKAYQDEIDAKRRAEDEEAEKKRILEKYKLYPYLGMKKHLKANGIPAKEVDECLGKYELKKLADAHGVELPDDPKQMKRR